MEKKTVWQRNGKQDHSASLWEFVKKFFTPKEWFEFCINMVVGVVAFFVIGRYVENEWGQTKINMIFDHFIETRAEWLVTKKTPSASWNDIVFFDLDADATTSLGHPYFFPRGIVATLVKYAADQDARLVLVDMDFSAEDSFSYKDNASQKDSDQGRANLAIVGGKAGDDILLDVLKKIRDNNQGKTKILLPKMSYADQTTKDSFLSQGLGETNDRIFWVSPHIYTSDADPYARFWTSYVETIDAENRKKILWTMPFMAAALYKEAAVETEGSAENKTPSKKLDEYAKDLLEFSKNPIDSQDNLAKVLEAVKKEIPWRKGEYFYPIVRANGEMIHVPDQRTRIAFEFISDNSPRLGTSEHFETDAIAKHIPGQDFTEIEKMIHKQIYHWHDGNGNEPKDIPLPSPADEKQSVGFLRRSSKGRGSTETEVTKEGKTIVDCKDKIVIIGRSDAEGKDLLWTPVELMPGMYIHGNIIATLLSEEELPHLAEPHWFLICNLLSLVIFSAIAVKFSSLWVWLLTLVLSTLTYLGFLTYFLATNTFLYAGAASIVVSIFDTVIVPCVEGLLRWGKKHISIS